MNEKAVSIHWRSARFETDKPFAATRFYQALRRSRVVTLVEVHVLGNTMFENLWAHPDAKWVFLHAPNKPMLLCGGACALGPAVVFVDIPRPLRNEQNMNALLDACLPPRLAADDVPETYILPPQSWVKKARHAPCLEFLIPTTPLAPRGALPESEEE